MDPKDREIVEKFDIKLKSQPKNGVILQLHHTIRYSNGESRRIRFSVGSFDDTHDKLACSDNVGNIFILDFSVSKFWKLPNVGVCTALHFATEKEDMLVAALDKKYLINFLDLESGRVLVTLTGHTTPIKHISFCSRKPKNLLTASSAEAILWEPKNYTKYFTLNTYLESQIQQIMFTPNGDYLVACFQNDTVQVWKQETMKSMKQIIPNDLKHMKCIAFTMNGRAMAMAGLSPQLILFCMDTWKAIKCIDLTKYSITGIIQVAFLPQLFDGGANKMLAILTSDCLLLLLNLETLEITHKVNSETASIRRFVVSPTGKYFFCILQQGEVNLYNTSYVFDEQQFKSKNVNKQYQTCKCPEPGTSTLKHTHQVYRVKGEVEQKMRDNMDSARLRRILMQYGEYPDKFRAMIWRSLLNTPRNKSAFSALVDKGIHPAFKNIEKQFTIHSLVTLKSLKRLLSCLAHWCPLFSVMKFLPGFVFPFVKVLQKDPLLLFECVATILINNCQLWFEYAPFPPISILAIIENILAEHDQQLLDHYCKMGITSQTYALKILETAFSEVLSCSEWLILWDHILSNEPAFILMAVVSYNIIQRNAIRRLKKAELLESFFHMQNSIDKKAFLKKTYVLLNETSSDIHPRKFFKTFKHLDKGHCYQQYTGYPKATICLKLAKNERKNVALTKQHTLKELTTKSQEQIIEEYKSEVSDNRSTYSDEVCEYNTNRHEYYDQPSYTCEAVKKDLIEDVMQPATQHLQNKDFSQIKYCRRHGKPSKKNNSKKRHEHLEEEVEKLICTTDLSHT